MSFVHQYGSFTNVHSRLKFGYYKTGDLHIFKFKRFGNFAFKNSLLREGYESFQDQLDAILKGELKGENSIDNYTQAEDSYLITDGDLFKIGKSKNPYKRLAALRTASPDCQLLGISRIPEKVLHFVFNRQRVKGEWFQFYGRKEEDVLWFFNKATQKEISCLLRLYMIFMKTPFALRVPKIEDDNYADIIIPFGMFSGTKVEDMKDERQLQYLKWLFSTTSENNKSKPLFVSIARFLKENQ